MWRFDDGGSLVYDWQASSYTIELPSGTAMVQVGSSSVVVTNSSITAQATSINLTGNVFVDGQLRVTGDINGEGKIIDKGGNTPNHKH